MCELFSENVASAVHMLRTSHATYQNGLRGLLEAKQGEVLSQILWHQIE